MARNLLHFAFAVLLLMAAIAPSAAAEKTCIVDFQASGCPHCANLKQHFAGLEQEYDLDVHYIDANKDSSAFIAMLKKHEVPVEFWGKVPTVFVGDEYCIGDAPCIEMLDEKLESLEGAECPAEIAGIISPNENQTGNNTGNNGTGAVSLTIPGITGLALVDAVNPCALAVLIILISSILLKDPRHRKKALLSGLAFSIAVFAAYFTLGALIIIGLKWLMGITSLSTAWLYKAFGAFAVILGLLNIKDYFWYGAGGFILEVPMKWRPRMKSFLQSVTSIKGAFIVGILVSVFLLPCTSGPYFVAGGLLAGIPAVSAMPWLFYYNFLFVSPMIALTLIICGGFVAVDEVSGWRERNIRRLHLFAGIVLAGLGIAMLAGLV